jgi:hypothetical protein
MGNRDGGFLLSQSWSPIINMLMNVKEDPAEQVLHSTHQPPLSRHQL